MANILMINFPAEGHVNPTLGMVKAFSDRGDTVHYITAERFKERLENAGAIIHTQPDLLSGVSIKPGNQRFFKHPHPNVFRYAEACSYIIKKN